MNKEKLLMKIACWIGYVLFAGYSAFMTAESIAMSFGISQTWIVFVFVFIVALIAGYCLSIVIGELQNRFNPSKSKFILGLLGFLLFWGVSFMTNVHYMVMTNEGLGVVTAELGVYKNYIENAIINNRDGIKEKETVDIATCEAQVLNYTDEFKRECDSSIRFGFGDRAIGYLKAIEDYFTMTSGKYGDRYVYKNSIFDDEKDRGDRGKTGAKEVMALKEKYSIRIAERLLHRENVIKTYYKGLIPQTKDMDIMKQFINDSLYVVDIPQLTEIATPSVYYQFSKVQLANTLSSRLSKIDKAEIERSMKESKTSNAADIEKGKFRYTTYPSSRMFSTFNVWGDMLHGRLPNDMKLLGWILFSLIIDIVAYVLRVLAR